MATHLPQNQFISNSTVSPRAVGSVVASKPPPVAGATAAPNSALASAMTADTDVAPDLTDPPVAASVLIAEPSMTMEVPSEASAPAPTKNPDADALGTDHIHEIFAGARKMHPPMDFLEEDELPLFIRDGDHLRRWEA